MLLLFPATSQAGFFDFLEKSLSGSSTTADTAQTVPESASQTTAAAPAATTGSLVDVLVQQLGVTPAQAQGGAGTLFQAAKSRMTDEAFQQVAQAVPGMDSLLTAAKPAGETSSLTQGLASLAGDQAGNVNTAASLINSFKELGLSGDMVSRFAPVMVDYVRQNGGEVAANLLSSALSGV